MSQARKHFIQRATSLRFALNEKILQSSPSDPPEKQSASRLIRNGLAIVGFCCLEDYLKTRSVEVASQLSVSGVPFVKLPEKMQVALTMGSAQGGVYRLKQERTVADKVRLVQRMANSVASTTGSGYSVSDFAFGMDRSNLDCNYVASIAKCFSIADFWTQINQMASMVGYGGAIDYKQSYENAMRNRHSAAHDPSFDAELADLTDWLDQAIAIAVSYDFLLSHRKWEIALGKNLPGENNVFERVALRKIIHRKQARQFAEYSSSNHVKAYRVESDYNLLYQAATARATANKEMLVALDSKLQAQDWYCS